VLRRVRARQILLSGWIASPSGLDTSPLQFALDNIESYLERKHGKGCPTDDRSSRQD
jgi:hypothetical protein